MKCKVIKAFRDYDGSMRLAGEIVELDDDRCGKLLGMRLVAPVEPAAPSKAPETASEEKPAPSGRPPIETATKRPRGNTALR